MSLYNRWPAVRDRTISSANDDAVAIANHAKDHYGFDAGAHQLFNTYSRSKKFFNRLDWNIDARNQLVIRNNTVLSEAFHMERDQFNFRFSSIGFRQVNNQSSTVIDLKSKINNRISNNLIIGYTSIHDYREPGCQGGFPAGADRRAARRAPPSSSAQTVKQASST